MAVTGSLERASSVERDERPTRVPLDRYVVLVVIVVVLAEWIRPMTSSLWLDETGTFFVLRAGGLHSVLHRALEFQGQFPLYYGLLWGWTRVFGMSEVALRLPSLLAGLASVWLVSRVAVRLFHDIVVARLTACILVMISPVAFAAADARPYSLTLAVFLAASLLLVRWLDTRRTVDGIAYLTLAALTLYLHYLFGLAFVAHLVLVAPRLRRMGQQGVTVAFAAVAIFALLLAPAVPHLLDVYNRRGAMSLFSYGSPMELLTYLVPPTIVAAFLVGRFAGSGEALSVTPPVVRRDVAVALAAWMIVPPTTIFLIGQVTGVSLWVEHHFLSYAPALAMLAACAFALLSPARQRIGIAVLATLFVLVFNQPSHNGDWRGAAGAANALSQGPQTPVLVYTGFSESQRLDWVRDPERSRLFLAPFLAYPIEGRMHVLPLHLTAGAERYVSAILATVAWSDRIIFVTDEIEKSYDLWLADATRPFGYTERTVAEFGGIRVLSFDRAP